MTIQIKWLPADSEYEISFGQKQLKLSMDELNELRQQLEIIQNDDSLDTVSMTTIDSL